MVPRVADVVYSEDNDSPSGAGPSTKMIFSIGKGPIILEIYYDDGDIVYWDEDGAATTIGHLDQPFLRQVRKHDSLGDFIANHFLIPHLRRLARRRNPR